MDADKTLDCKGLNCPLPIVRTRKTLETMQSGEILKVECTDKGSTSDMTAFAQRTGNELLEIKEEGNTFVFFLRKK